MARAYGMPPFAQALKSSEFAAVLSQVRQSCGNRGRALSERWVLR